MKSRREELADNRKQRLDENDRKRRERDVEADHAIDEMVTRNIEEQGA